MTRSWHIDHSMKLHLTFDSFNARHSSERLVGETFIDNGLYERVGRVNHSVILGPRGSGKTTLLKMLTLSARQAWIDAGGKPQTNDLPFTAIYIPTDIHFQRQLQNADQRFSSAPHTRNLISRAAVTTSLLIACVDCFQERIRIQKLDDLSRLLQLSEQLSDGWRLPKKLPDLGLIRLALRGRMIELGKIVSSARADSLDEHLALDLPAWVGLDFLELSLFACEAFDVIFDFDVHSLWAWCFDELELAPSWLLGDLMKILRSVDSKIILKLGTSPHPDVEKLSTASPLNDFDPIKLWSPSMVHQRQFCRSLANQVLLGKLGYATTPEALLGESSWLSEEQDSDAGSKAYDRGSEEWELFLQEAKHDPEFAKFLQSRGIDPLDPVAPTEKHKDSVLRKIKPLVLFRKNFSYFDSRSGRRRKKTRKVRAGFFGTPAVYDITDGNPRFIKRIFEEFAALALKAGISKDECLERNAQTRIIEKISLQFHNYIRAIPASHTNFPGSHRPVYLYSLLHGIGKYFSDRILLDSFSSDPVSSFVVGVDTPKELVNLLQIAAEHAAIVELDNESDFDTNVVGKRFRLSFLLAPLCKVPLRIYASIGVMKCLDDYPPLHPFAKTAIKTPVHQDTLF